MIIVDLASWLAAVVCAVNEREVDVDASKKAEENTRRKKREAENWKLKETSGLSHLSVGR